MTRWENLFAQFSDKKVLVIGDLMLDSYLFGKVDRISPEAPVPVVSVLKRDTRLGGAANVALNIKELGAQVEVASVIGEDESGVKLLELLVNEGIGISGVCRSSQRRTTVKHRIIGNNSQMLRVDEEDLFNLNKNEYGTLVEWVNESLHQFDVIIFEDYDKGVISPELIQLVVERAKLSGIPTVVDPKKNNFLAYHHVTLFKPNLKEIKDGLNMKIEPKDEISLKMSVHKLQETIHAQYVMVTLSEKGVVMSDGKDYIHVPAHVRTISDVSGAGDTVISVAAMCLACNASMQDIAFLSNLAGGLVCEKIGVVPINKELLLNEANKLG